MPAPSTTDEFLELVRKSGLVDQELLDDFLKQLASASTPLKDARALAVLMIRNALLTGFQADQLLQGKWRGFSLGKYDIMERIGSGGMGIVYLCMHKVMQRPVALKVLPASLATDAWFLKRFYQEAQAVAALDHSNIVRAYDIDEDNKRHFLVMEYVDGSNLHDVVSKFGPLDVFRAAHYIRQAAQGLQHAHEVGLVHRDIKPGNLLLSRQGVIKILDMGLARFFHTLGEHSPHRDNMEKMVGTDDFLPPEQVVDSGNVDSRADIYGLGATFYFFLTGQAPFQEVENQHLKLVAHLTRQPRAVQELRPDVPQDLIEIVDKMMAKNPWDRYQVPAEVDDALEPWTREPIPLPPEQEMPRLSPLAIRSGLYEGPLSGVRLAMGGSSLVLRRPAPAESPGSHILSNAQVRTPTGQTTKPQRPKITTKSADAANSSPPASDNNQQVANSNSPAANNNPKPSAASPHELPTAR